MGIRNFHFHNFLMVHPTFVATFENAWVALRSRWCDRTDLNGAVAFSDDHIKITMLHRVVQVDVDDDRVEGLIDDALRFFEEKRFDCAFTLSSNVRPPDFAKRLEQRGFEFALQANAMVCDRLSQPRKTDALEIERTHVDGIGAWMGVMCEGFSLPKETRERAESALDSPEVRLYLARIEGEPAGTALLYSHEGMGYVDLVGTLPSYRGRGIASNLVARIVTDSQTIGNRWTALEVGTDGPAQRIYERLGFRSVYQRPRYLHTFGKS